MSIYMISEKKVTNFVDLHDGNAHVLIIPPPGSSPTDTGGDNSWVKVMNQYESNGIASTCMIPPGKHPSLLNGCFSFESYLLNVQQELEELIQSNQKVILSTSSLGTLIVNKLVNGYSDSIAGYILIQPISSLFDVFDQNTPDKTQNNDRLILQGYAQINGLRIDEKKLFQEITDDNRRFAGSYRLLKALYGKDTKLFTAFNRFDRYIIKPDKDDLIRIATQSRNNRDCNATNDPHRHEFTAAVSKRITQESVTFVKKHFTTC